MAEPVEDGAPSWPITISLDGRRMDDALGVCVAPSRGESLAEPERSDGVYRPRSTRSRSVSP